MATSSENEIDYYYDMIMDEVDPVLPTQSHEHQYIPLDGHYICQLCGEYHPYLVYFYENTYPKYKRQKYRRKGYFREKLKLIIGQKQSISDNYNQMLNDIKTKYVSKNIHDLQKIIKKKYGKYNKYIHSIHYDLTGERLINLTEEEINNLENKFNEFEQKFLMLYPDSFYMISYNVIIYHLLKSNDFEIYKHILLPKNYTKTKSKFCMILRD